MFGGFFTSAELYAIDHTSVARGHSFGEINDSGR